MPAANPAAPGARLQKSGPSATWQANHRKVYDVATTPASTPPTSRASRARCSHNAGGDDASPCLAGRAIAGTQRGSVLSYSLRLRRRNQGGRSHDCGGKTAGPGEGHTGQRGRVLSPPPAPRTPSQTCLTTLPHLIGHHPLLPAARPRAPARRAAP
eukprot:170957-Chlamydomonas_euryale.AAC.4